MEDDTERRALDLFEQWLDLDANDQAHWLEAATAGNPALRAAAFRLIAAHNHSTMIPTMPPEPVNLSTSVNVPKRIGSWRIVAPIGEGGMGTVYRAERADGLFRQTAAIKLVRPGLFSAKSARQFAKEREILAGLQHPHIARLYDGGTSEDGLSYFVMELIDGVSITHHCRHAGLSLTRRIELVLPLCDAVSYAHQRLVVHADIKPGNVLVDPDHGVKLLDFGISRLSGEAEDENAHHGMSLRYASPQLKVGNRAVVTDDVYALGMLLGDLCEDQEADAELQAVVAKAQADNVDVRYSSVNALADDLRRWLSGFPVHAIALSRKRSGMAFFHRNRFAVIVSSIALLALVVSAIVSTLLYFQADANRTAAERRFGDVRSLASYLMFDVDPQLARLSGSLPVRRAAADRASAYLEALSRDANGNTALTIEAARGHLRLAGIYGYDPVGTLGDLPMAQKHLRQAKTLLDSVHANAKMRNDVVLAKGEYALTLAASNLVLESRDAFARAERSIAAAQREFARVKQSDPSNIPANYGDWRAAVYKINMLMKAGPVEEAVSLGESLKRQQHLKPKTAGQQAEYDFLETVTLVNLAQAHYELRGYRQSLENFELAEKAIRKIIASGRGSAEVRYLLTIVLSGIGDCLMQNGQHGRALDYGQQSLSLLLELQKDGPNDNIDEEIAVTRIGLARQLAKLDRTSEALNLVDSALIHYAEKAKSNPKLPAAQRRFAIALQTRALILRSGNNFRLTCKAATAAQTQWRNVKLLGDILEVDKDRNEGMEALLKIFRNCGSRS